MYGFVKVFVWYFVRVFVRFVIVINVIGLLIFGNYLVVVELLLYSEYLSDSIVIVWIFV